MVQHISTLDPPAPLVRLPVPARVARHAAHLPRQITSAARLEGGDAVLYFFSAKAARLVCSSANCSFRRCSRRCLCAYVNKIGPNAVCPTRVLGVSFKVVEPLFEACTEGTLQHRRERSNR